MTDIEGGAKEFKWIDGRWVLIGAISDDDIAPGGLSAGAILKDGSITTEKLEDKAVKDDKIDDNIHLRGDLEIDGELRVHGEEYELTLEQVGEQRVVDRLLLDHDGVANVWNPALAKILMNGTTGDIRMAGELDPKAVVFVPQGIAPSEEEGKVYYDDAAKLLRLYDGTVWKDVGVPGITKLSELEINEDKNWNVKSITNIKDLAMTGKLTVGGAIDPTEIDLPDNAPIYFDTAKKKSLSVLEGFYTFRSTAGGYDRNARLVVSEVGARFEFPTPLAGLYNVIASHYRGIQIDTRSATAGRLEIRTLQGVEFWDGKPFTIFSDGGETPKFLVDGATGNATIGGNLTVSGALAAALNAGGFGITNLLDPVNLQDAATKKYVDDAIAPEALWNRVGTVLSPQNAGDDVDLGTGDITATDAHFTGKLIVGGIDPTRIDYIYNDAGIHCLLRIDGTQDGTGELQSLVVNAHAAGAASDLKAAEFNVVPTGAVGDVFCQRSLLVLNVAAPTGSGGSALFGVIRNVAGGTVIGAGIFSLGSVPLDYGLEIGGSFGTGIDFGSLMPATLTIGINFTSATISGRAIEVAGHTIGGTNWSIDGTGNATIGGNLTVSGALAAALNAGGFGITNLLDPTLTQDAATKAYVDAQIAPEALWNRVTDAENYLVPQTAADSIFLDSGNIKFLTDGVGDIGAAGANRPNNAYIKNQVVVGSSITISGVQISLPPAGAINGSGNLYFTGASMLRYTGTGGVDRVLIHNMGQIYVRPASANAIVIAVTDTADNNKINLRENGNIEFDGNLQVGILSPTTVIDASRNLTNINNATFGGAGTHTIGSAGETINLGAATFDFSGAGSIKGKSKASISFQPDEIALPASNPAVQSEAWTDIDTLTFVKAAIKRCTIDIAVPDDCDTSQGMTVVLHWGALVAGNGTTDTYKWDVLYGYIASGGALPPASYTTVTTGGVLVPVTANILNITSLNVGAPGTDKNLHLVIQRDGTVANDFAQSLYVVCIELKYTRKL